MIASVAAIALLQALHLLALSLVCGCAVLLNAAAWRRSETALSSSLLCGLWTGLLATAGTGGFLALAEPDRAWPNPAFRMKMGLAAAAVAAVYAWGRTRGASRRAQRAVGAVVLLLLVAAVVAGRLIAYTETA